MSPITKPFTEPFTEPSLFTDPHTLPLRSIETIAADTALVVAPHPDDETLGCGGAIALLRSLHCAVHVLVVSDGTLSHPRSQKYPAAALRSLREAETQSAMRLLNVNADHIQFLRLPDGGLTVLDDLTLQGAINRCCAALDAIAPQVVFLPYRSDPHPDHRAAWQLMRRALADAPVRQIEYPIWDWDAEQRGTTLPERAWRLDIHAAVAQKQQAIAAYRSQTTALVDDDPQGFRLTPEMLDNFTRPWELYFEETP